MSDYISREDVTTNICYAKCGIPKGVCCKFTEPCTYVKIINNFPSADVRENKGEWIPVTERLPEVNQNVLATTRWREVTIAERLNIGPDYCIGPDYWFIHEGNTNAHTEDIVAWQPLPEPYKAESEE